MDPQGTQFLIRNGLVKEMDLSQTEKGITVTIEWAYADVNRIVIGYTVKHPGDRYHGVLSLADRDGSDFPQIVGDYGYVGDGLSSQVISFDASSVHGTPESLALRLNLQISTFNLPGETSAPLVSTVDAETGVTFAEMEPIKIDPSEATFGFDFSVPFHPGRKIEIGQSAYVAGVEITLKRITIAPSDTRLEFCFAGLDPEVKSWTPLISIDPEKGWSGDSDMVLQGGRWGSEDCYEYHFAAPLQEQRGIWMVTVTEMIGDKSVVYNEESEEIYTYEQIRLGGPWIYRFHVPVAEVVEIPAITFEEAQNIVSFDIPQPSKLPGNLVLTGAHASSNWVNVYYKPIGDGDAGFGYEITQGKKSGYYVYPEAAKTIVDVAAGIGICIQGAENLDGEWKADADVMSLEWSKQEFSYRISQSGLGLNCEDLIEIAESFDF